MNSEIVDDVTCIVVHHRSPETLIQTTDSLIAAGLPREHILVVDNGGDQELAARVRALGFPVIETVNRGYAAAVNDGLSYLRASLDLQPLTLISTHESIADSNAVRGLRGAVLSDNTIAVAGPTLMNADRAMQIWSTGGFLTPRLKLPRHHVTEESGSVHGGLVDREWLDGAFTLYRTEVLERSGLEELYFLYFEETDLHTRLRREGHRVVWVPMAKVSQKSSGIPSRLLGRNLMLFHSRLFSNSRGRLAVGFELIRSLARAALTRRGKWSAFPAIASGWMEGERLAKGKPTRKPYPSEQARLS